MTKILINRGSIQLLRIFVSGIFLVAGMNHLLNIEKTAKKIEQASFKGIAYFFWEPQWLIILSGTVMVAPGFLFLIGYDQMGGNLFDGGFDPHHINSSSGANYDTWPLFKNIAILGGLLFFYNEQHR